MTRYPLRPFTEREVAEHCTEGGARLLIMRLQSHWPTAKFWTEPVWIVGGSKSGPMVAIRSNLLNGLPR